MTAKVRFAPSPTGFLHVGNVRTALVNWLFARHTGGHFMLRIDDTDIERSKPEYTAAIEEDLRWLGLNWDSEMHQSSRLERYKSAVARLRAQDRLYAAYETPEELDVQRKMLASRGLPPIYRRASDEQIKKYESEGRKPHWRFRLTDDTVEWNDLIRGPVAMKATTMSDPVLMHGEDVPVYTLASVVDDGELSITHVIRGEDHVSNTAVQIQLFEALGFQAPSFAHMALIRTKEGEMSKRLGGNDIRTLKAAGILPMAIDSLLARMGTSDPIEAMAELQPLIDSFDFAKFGRAPAVYDVNELARLNEKIMHHMSFEEAKRHWPELEENFWLSIRGNVGAFDEAKEWWNILHSEVNAELNHDDRAFLREASHHLPPEPWNETTYDAWIAALKPTTPRKGKELFLPLRRALTGLDHGPELKKLLPLLGREKTIQRLS